MRLILFLIFINFSVYAKDILNLYIGSNYITEPTIKRFEEISSYQLNQSYFNDNEEMLAKIVAGAKGYDVIVATTYAIEELVKMGKVRPLDLTKLTNLKEINHKFLNSSFDPHNKYSVPYAYTPVLLAYNKKKLAELKITPNSWAVIFDPKYLSKLKGHVTMFSSPRHVFAAALLYLGKDPNSTNLVDINMALKVIKNASKYWTKFDSDSYYRGLLRGDIWLAQSYSIDIFKVIKDVKASKANIEIDALLQKEGNMYELDNMVIPKSSTHVVQAYQFINNSLASQSAYELATKTGSSIPNNVALKKLDSKITGINWIYPNNAKTYSFKAYDPKTRILINQLWTEIQMQCR